MQLGNSAVLDLPFRPCALHQQVDTRLSCELSEETVPTRARMMLSDAELIRRILGGEKEQFELLVRRYQDLLYRHAFGMVSDHDAATDLVQESFIKAYTNLAQCQDPSRFSAWIFRIVRNRCHDFLKNRRQKNVSLDDEVIVATAKDDPVRAFEQVELQEAITHALASLPAVQREAFLLKHVEGRSYEEMTELLGASISALKMRVLRARESLQLLLQPQ